MPASNHFFRHRLGPHCVKDESDDHVAQVELVVEPVGNKGCELGLGVLAILQRLEGTRNHSLEVAQHGVYPLKLE